MNNIMDNKYGELDTCYTIDGLHLSEKGYAVLNEVITLVIKELA